MARPFKTDDIGKTVVTGDGDTIGTIEEASGSSARVMPHEGLSQSIRRRLGWTEENIETYPLKQSEVDSFASDEIVLKHRK